MTYKTVCGDVENLIEIDPANVAAYAALTGATLTPVESPAAEPDATDWQELYVNECYKNASLTLGLEVE